MANHKSMAEFLSLNMVVLTISDSHRLTEVRSGQLLAQGTGVANYGDQS